MKSPINSGYFDLQEPDISNLVESVLNLLNRFINSNAEVSLDDTFTIYFRVYSMGHVHHINSGRRMRIVGSKSKSIFPGTLQSKIGYPENPQAFSKSCFLTSIVLSHLRLKLSDPNSEPVMKDLTLVMKACDGEKKIFPYGSTKKNQPSEAWNDVSPNILNRAGKLLFEKLKAISIACGVSSSEQIDLHDSVPKVANHLNCQIHVIQGFAGEKASLISYPPEFDDSKPQIVLENLVENHVTVVTNLKKFFRYFNKEICFACLKTFSIGYKHYCKKQKTCFSCKKPLRASRTLNHFDPFFAFCDSELKNFQFDKPQTCTTCNANVLTELCQKSHKSICGTKGQGRAGYFCVTCNNFFKLGFKNATDAKDTHICNINIKRCPFCKEQKGRNHQCLVKDVYKTTKVPKLAFFAFSFKSAENCADCHLLRINFKTENNITWMELYLHKNFLSLVCSRHKLSSNFETTPNAAIILSEVSPGSFKRKVLFDDTLKSESLEHQHLENVSYIPKEFSSMSEPFAKEKKKLGTEIEMIVGYLKEKKIKTVIDKFLIEILNQKYRNTTFLSFDADRQHNHVILKSFSDINVIPFVIQNGGKINMVSIRSLEVRFLNASSFIDGPLEDWVAQFSLDNELYYFPDK